jgi:hypothetical protein
MKAKPMTGGGGAKPAAKKKMQDLKNAAKTASAKKNSTMKPKPDGGKKKPAVATTGARVTSRYGALKPVGNPGAGVFQKENQVSDYIFGAKPYKQK